MERKDFTLSIKLTFIVLFGMSLFWFLFSCQLLWAYDPGGAIYDLKKNSRMNDTILIQPGTGTSGGSSTARFRTYYGTQACVGVGSNGYILSGTLTGLPFIDYLYGNGSSTINFSGFTRVAVGGSDIPSSSSVTGKIDAVGGTGTTNVLTDTTLAGQGTLTATFRANGVNISSTEMSYLDDVSSNIQTQITTATGSITNHTHTGSDGTTQIAHNNVTGTGTNSHATIDSFIASKASASGLASLDGSSLVVQNPANATSSPTASKIPISLGTGKLDDSWLSNNITKLGTPTTDNISEGSTNKYYTDGRVNAAVGSLSVNVLSDVVITSPANGQFVKYDGANWINGTSSASVAFSEVTGSASASQLPLISGMLGSATSAQLPTVLKLYGTTTEQAAGAFGQLYVQSSSGRSGGDVTGFGTLTTTSLVSYYRLADLIDDFGTNDLTNYGATTFVAGKYGNCATFNGTTQYLQTGLLSAATTNISMFGWVYIPSASTHGGFMFNGSADSNGYALGVGSTVMDTDGNNLIFLLPGLLQQSLGAIGTGWHHVGITRDGTTWRGYLDGVPIGSTYTNNPNTPTTNFTIGNRNGAYFNDKIDDVVFYNKCLSGGEIIELYNNTSASVDVSIQYSAKYADPVNGNTVFEILTPGTATTEASYIYNNATTTVFGLGTNTAITATSTAYSGWFDGAVRATAFNVASTEKIKENIKDIKIKPDMLDAEGMAKQNYIAGAKAAWIVANQANYTTMVNETGTGSVAVVDATTMESDYNNYIELEWAADMNQDAYTENIQKTYEKGFWQMFDTVTPKSWNPKDKPSLTRKGFVVEDMPDVVKGDDGQSIDPMALIAYVSLVQQTLKADTIFALSTLKELITTGTVTQQKIDYCNDRLDVLNP